MLRRADSSGGTSAVNLAPALEGDGSLSASLPVHSLHVLVVDDSAVVRQTIRALLSTQAGIHTSVARDPLMAMEKMKQERPDVIILDLETPRMDGLTFLRKIMDEDPFTRSFAKRLNEVCAIEVKEAESGDELLEGRALLAPGDRHLVVLQRSLAHSSGDAIRHAHDKVTVDVPVVRIG